MQDTDMKKICVLPNDPLGAYLKKGVVKYGYFNPFGFFDEVHVISLFDDEIDAGKVSGMAGEGKLIIHVLGKANLTNYRSFEAKVEKLVKEIDPLIIRTFNPIIQGWLAVKVGKKLAKPVVISIHADYDQQRDVMRKKGECFMFLKSWYVSKMIERYALKNADLVICVYNFLVPYAKKMGAWNVRVIYNKVNLENFSPDKKPAIKNKVPTIISVGRHVDQKNQMYLLQAMRTLDMKLLLIGDGVNRGKLREFIDREGLADKVKMMSSVPNSEMAGYYASSDIAAQVMENYGGVPIPILEAMASGTPMVVSRHGGDYAEATDEATYFVDNDADSFREAFLRLTSDDGLRRRLVERGLEIMQEIGGDAMEAAELEEYKTLMQK